MSSISELNQSSFNNPELLAKIKTEAQDLIEHISAPEASRMARELERKLNELAALQVSAPQIFVQYQMLLIRLRFLSLANWSDAVYFDLIKNHLSHILGSDINISDRMTGKLYMIPESVWPDVAEQTLEALRQNIQPVGSRQLIIAGEQNTHPPLIKYWLLDYDRHLGKQRHENIERAKYFTDSRNYLALNDLDKLKIQQLLEFYDGLRPLPLPEEELRRPREEGTPAVAIPRQRGEEGEFDFREEEEPTFPYPGQEAEPSAAAYQPPATKSAPANQSSPRPSAPPSGLPTNQPASPAPSRPSAPPPPPPPPSVPQQKDTYREQVETADMAGPQAPSKPAPKLNGNVINLKDLGSWQ